MRVQDGLAPGAAHRAYNTLPPTSNRRSPHRPDFPSSLRQPGPGARVRDFRPHRSCDDNTSTVRSANAIAGSIFALLRKPQSAIECIAYPFTISLGKHERQRKRRVNFHLLPCVAVCAPSDRSPSPSNSCIPKAATWPETAVRKPPPILGRCDRCRQDQSSIRVPRAGFQDNLARNSAGRSEPPNSNRLTRLLSSNWIRKSACRAAIELMFAAGSQLFQSIGARGIE